MVQTTIDQFYKVTSSNKKPASVKNIKESSNHRSPIVGKKGRQSSSKLKTFPVHENAKQSPCEVNRKQRMQNNVSLNDEVYCLSKTDMKNSPTKTMATKPMISPTVKHTSPTSNQKKTPVSNSDSKFSPKTSSPIRNESHRFTRIVRRKLFKDRTEELLSVTINNLNSAKEGIITNNDINLEKVYSSRKFSFKYNPIDTTASMRYEIEEVIEPTDMYSLHFFLSIVTVFSNPVNCGYFNEEELDFIFSLLTLSKCAQALLIRMLKRKHTWHRISNIKYDEISNDLKPIFDELVLRSIFKSSMKEEDLSVLLNLLQVDEIRKICQESKVNCSSKKKEDYIQSILKFCNETRSLFPGMLSPATKLRASVNKRLGSCVLLNTRVKQMVDRIITLLMPNRDPTETLADVFLTILKVETNQMKFPKVKISEFPIFASKGHLLDYIEVKSTLSDILSAIEKKQWDIVRNLGSLAAQRLPLFLEMETQGLQDSTLPRHIRCFLPGYMWLKVLSKSIDAFKKTKETMPQAIEFLHTLINQDCHMKNRKGLWFGELIKIEMHHMKNLDASVALLSNAVSYESLTEVDKLDLLDRAEMLDKRKTAISKSTKATVRRILDNILNKARPTSQTSSITIEGMLCGNTLQRKSTWCIRNGVDQQMYGSVESFALYHYKSKGYSKGVHCEGAFPITLFGTLFWDEIYNIDIPGPRPLYLQISHLAVHAPLESPHDYGHYDRQFMHIREINRRKYARMVSRLDNSVGRIVQALGSRGMLKDSLILFLTDNGAASIGKFRNYGSNYPLRGMKYTLYEGGVRGAAVLWSPRLRKTARVCDDLMHVTDWLPTLYSIAGGDVRDLGEIDGVDQWCMLNGSLPSARDRLLLNIDEISKTEGAIYKQFKLLRGSIEGGYYDGYYRDIERLMPHDHKKSIQEDMPLYTDTVLKSAVSQSITRHLGDPVTQPSTMIQLRREATVNCRPRDSFITCNVTECLFDINNDPCETKNIAEQYSRISRELDKFLEHYGRNVKRQIKISVDWLADPRRTNNTWEPWLISGENMLNNSAVQLASLTYCVHIGIILVTVTCNGFI